MEPTGKWHGMEKVEKGLYSLTFKSAKSDSKVHIIINLADLKNMNSVLTGEIERLQRR